MPVKKLSTVKKTIAAGAMVLGLTFAMPTVSEAALGETLRLGAVHNDVKELQEILNKQGFYDYTIDGIYGPVTRQAVIDLQSETNILIDGIFGPQSFKALHKLTATTETSVPSAKPPQSVSVAVTASAKQGETYNMEATAYSADCKGCSGITAAGIDLRANPDQKVIAVDPSVIPLGTRVHVEGYGEAIAGDIGSAIKGHKIDLFMPSRSEALRYGKQDSVKVTVLD